MTSHSNESTLNPIGGFFLLEPLHPRYLGWMISSECHESPAVIYVQIPNAEKFVLYLIFESCLIFEGCGFSTNISIYWFQWVHQSLHYISKCNTIICMDTVSLAIHNAVTWYTGINNNQGGLKLRRCWSLAYGGHQISTALGNQPNNQRRRIWTHKFCHRSYFQTHKNQ